MYFFPLPQGQASLGLTFLRSGTITVVGESVLSPSTSKISMPSSSEKSIFLGSQPDLPPERGDQEEGFEPRETIPSEE